MSNLTFIALRLRTFKLRGTYVGLLFTFDRRTICSLILAAHRVVRRPDGNQIMNGSEIIGLVLSVGLLVYLTIALLKPEWFA